MLKGLSGREESLSRVDDGWNGRWKEGEQFASGHAFFRPITSVTGVTEKRTAEQGTDGLSPQVERGGTVGRELRGRDEEGEGEGGRKNERADGDLWMKQGAI